MKIYLNRRPIIGPWGGGNRFITEFVKELQQNDYQVIFDINESNIDRYICFDPRPGPDGVTIEHIINAVMKTHGQIIYRIGDVGTHNKPELTKLLLDSLRFADRIIFTSEWALNYLLSKSHVDGIYNRSYIVSNGADQRFIDAYSYHPIVGNIQNASIVTHHWSNNPKKGFEIYQSIDENFKFKFIGRTPENCKFSNHIAPCDVDSLIQQLDTANIYLTASQEEAGANHVLEAMALGLPIVYSKNGGSIPEYCKGFGIEYNGTYEDAIEAITESCKNTYPRFSRSINASVKEFISLL